MIGTAFERIGGRKFVALVLALALVAGADVAGHPLSQPTVDAVLALFGAFVLGNGVEAVVRARVASRPLPGPKPAHPEA